MGRRYKVELSLTRSELITIESMLRGCTGGGAYALAEYAQGFNEMATKYHDYRPIKVMREERAMEFAEKLRNLIGE